MTELELGNFNTSNATNMSAMFKNLGHEKLTSLILPDTFNTSRVTDMVAMFEGCGYKSMTTLSLGNSFNTINSTQQMLE